MKEEFAASKNSSGGKLSFGDIAIDLDKREVYLDNVIVALKPKEYELLLFLAEHAGRVIPRDTLLEKVWGWEYTGDSRTVDVHIRWLREKLEKDPSHPRHFMTIRSVGYRFEG
jgi:DNA-binding response OmpR family regulator